ncbi:MAG: UDP-N-acetylmuramate--L-alanine ligase [Patescibacteria group bacterium]|nr:UDP-N-acetylmuramate--L-alanine ligase [Patescibacteria group bacterium]
MKKLHSIHFVGIKGVGMTPLAIIAKQAGFRVTGSDIKDRFITDESLEKAGIEWFSDFSKSHVKGIDLVIATGAHGGLNNIEVQEARKLGIEIWLQGRAVGEFMKGDIFKRKFEGISVAGCHGKTTTAAMIATIIKEAGLDPSFAIGTGSIFPLGLPGHLGQGKYFVAEADEYATEPNFDKTAKFLWQYPVLSVFTNIEFDHPDLYPSIDEVRRAFLEFANNLPLNGILVIAGDDPQCQKLIRQYKRNIVTFGFNETNDFSISRISFSSGKTFFRVRKRNLELGEFVLQVPGEHNVLNAFGAIAACLELGIEIGDIKDGLKKFSGTKRRFEYIGQLETGALVYDDYAHHPTEIKNSLKAFRKVYPKSKIICIFQPHTYSRTKSLFDEFARSFSDANTVILLNIYSSSREKSDQTVSSKLLTSEINNQKTNALFLPSLLSVVKYISQESFGGDTVIITMGAGDVYKISEKLKWKN